MKKISVDQDKLPSLAGIAWRGLSRRRFFRSATSTGAGLVLGSNIGTISAHDNDEEEEHRSCRAVPRPIPHITGPGHFFFPGPVEGAPTTDPNFPNAGHDPSIITDFSGVIAEADLAFSGTGTDLNTGQSAHYDFHTDMRFMSGVFVGLDNEEHHGTFGFT